MIPIKTQKSYFKYLFFIAVLFCNNCYKEKSTAPTSIQNPTARIAVMADCHYFDPDLGTEGEAFENDIAQDRKMVAESEAILEAMVQDILSEDVEIVLVPGDLTKDGELTSHQKVAEYLQQLENLGMRVYVIPGNHDINNPHAMSYSGDTATPVASVTEEQFAEIYSEFGFNEATAQDTASLTYIVEPVNGLWILCMDCCRYSENTTTSVTGGKFTNATFNWIKSKLSEAHDSGKLVFGMMHHGLLEHFNGQKLLFPDYVIDEYNTIWPEFAELGMKVVFTGHFHAQDIRKMSTESAFIFDIETGAGVTYPCPYRTVHLNGERMLVVESKCITWIDYDTGTLSFQQYARSFLENGLDSIAASMLINTFHISADSAQIIAPYLSDAVIAHYAGDEEITTEAAAFIGQLNSTGDLISIIIANGLNAIYTDPEPADNNISIDLNTGEIDQTVLTSLSYY